MRARATLSDVAKRAGVAPITASRAINGTGYVSEEVSARVAAAVLALGYVPNTLARSLRSQRSHVVALVLSDITNPFFTTVARGVQDAAGAAGLLAIVCNTDESEEIEARYLRMLVEQRVDGVLLVPAGDARASVEFLKRHQTAAVVLDRRAPGAEVDVVRCDGEGGAYELMRHLVGLGHSKVAVLTGPKGVSPSEERVAGCLRALPGASVYCGEPTQASGYALAVRALAARPTAILATNNFIGLGARKAVRDAGVKLALAGFDDLPEELVVTPFLTVVSQPAYEMGRRAVEILTTRIGGKAPEGYREVVLSTRLIVRESSGEGLNL